MPITLENIANRLDHIEEILCSRQSPWLTFQECCDYLKVGRTKLQSMVVMGEIRSGRIGNRLRFLKKDCDSLILYQNSYANLTKGQQRKIDELPG